MTARLGAMVLLAVGGVFFNMRPALAQDSNILGSGISKKAEAAADKGLRWLVKNQRADGSWGKTYRNAVTAFACLSFLSNSIEPYQNDERGKALVKGLEYLLKQQKDGMFSQQGHSWIHGQGFATLAIAEAYGRMIQCKTKPALKAEGLRKTVENAVKVIVKHQSTSGGWWYTQGSQNSHEGSTTVCAVQAIVSAKNFGIPVDEKALERGFEYLKKCQNDDGGFDYRLGDSHSMKEGTAAGVATLGLMKKFDYTVMIKGYQFLLKLTPKRISTERFPYYGHFYGCMGMHLLWQEYKVDKTFRKNTIGYIAKTHEEVLAWQQPNGSWAPRGWVKSNSQEDTDYATAYATLVLLAPEARLSIYNRKPPKLPKAGS